MKPKKILILPLLLMALISIMTLTPKTKAELIKIEEDTEITSISTALKGKIYAHGTQVMFQNETYDNYYYVTYKKDENSVYYENGGWENFTIGRDGSLDLEGTYGISYWKFEDIQIEPGPTQITGYSYHIILTPVVVTEPTETSTPTFSIDCDAKEVSKGKETKCHFKAKGIKLTRDDLKFDLSSEDFEIKNVQPSTYFSTVKNELPKIQLRTSYIDTDTSNLEIISFDIKAIKDKGNPDNIRITNIQLRETTYSEPVKATVDIVTKSSSSKTITTNPKTKQNLIIGIILLLIITASTIIIIQNKKKRMYN